MKALVCDAHSIASLECVRSLGMRGVRVVTAGEAGVFPLARYSRYSSGFRTYHSPSESIERFIGSLLDIVREEKPEVTLFATDRTILPLSRERDAFRGLTRTVLPGAGPLATACDKVATLELARRLRVPAPETAFVRTPDDLGRAADGMTPPFVAKPRSSHAIEGGRVTARRGVIFIGGREELGELYSLDGSFSAYPIVQEWRPGFGVGVSGLFDRGRPVALFSHRRIREEHPLGGRSSYCESIARDDALTRYTTAMMSELQWHGPAMVEFRVGEEGRATLMEINGRLWGSLPLSVASGLDFPWLLCLLAGGEAVEGAHDYAVGRRGRYLLADINHLLSALAGRPGGWRGAYPSRRAAIIAFTGAFFREATYFSLRRNDPAPGLRELSGFFRTFPSKVLKRGGGR